MTKEENKALNSKPRELTDSELEKASGRSLHDAIDLTKNMILLKFVAVVMKRL